MVQTVRSARQSLALCVCVGVCFQGSGLLWNFEEAGGEKYPCVSGHDPTTVWVVFSTPTVCIVTTMQGARFAEVTPCNLHWNPHLVSQ
jgi:hypothetical protein